MTIDEMIEVLQAYKEGKKIEIYDDSREIWVDIVGKPAFDFGVCDYRVKRNPTNLEVANKIWKDTFGIDKRFGRDSCPAFDCDYCPITRDECKFKGCREWWNEEYKGVVEEQKGGTENEIK